MKPKSEGEAMKTLNDVIKEMHKNSKPYRSAHYEKWVRRACEAMAKEIVPKETTHFDFGDGESYSKSVGWNDCRDEILKNIAEFMGEKK